MTPKKPTLNVIGEDGNAFNILSKAARVARRHGLDWDAIQAEATSGDYQHLLATIEKHFEVQ